MRSRLGQALFLRPPAHRIRSYCSLQFSNSNSYVPVAQTYFQKLPQAEAAGANPCFSRAFWGREVLSFPTMSDAQEAAVDKCPAFAAGCPYPDAASKASEDEKALLRSVHDCPAFRDG
eukprot:scaffold2285_cov143-Pinguiococcus_pyrenoidosus.AAC.1